jgi:release factor glutamine methyltransferase
VRELFARTAGYLASHGVPSARLDAEVLLGHVLGLSRLELYRDAGRPVTREQDARYRALARSRACERVPVAYLTGEREFWSHAFRVTRDVLIPRPETELLVQVAAGLAPRRVAEVGVGSGAVAGALARELPEARIVGIDVSAPALAVAAANLERLRVADRVGLVQGDGTAPLSGPFDLIVSNPPYVPSGEIAGLAPELRHEPRLALDGGPDGLDFVRRLAREAPDLAPGGDLVLEIGAGQAAAACDLLRSAGAERVRRHRDLAGIERVIEARLPAAGGA